MNMLTDEQAYMKAQIHDTLRLRGTDELLDIWRRADHEEWTDLAFEVVHEILLERLGEIPAPEPDEQSSEAAETSPELENPVPAVQPGDIQKFLRQQTYDAMDEMDTDQILEIWQEADHDEWTDLAFEVVQQILLERLGEVPARESEESESEEQDSEDESELDQEPDETEPESKGLLDVSPAGNEPQLFNDSFDISFLRCPDCGKEIHERDIVCPHCGVDLEAPLDETQLQALAAEYIEKAQNSYDLGHDFKSALSDCDQALEFTPNSAPLHNLRGLILDALDKTGLAIQEYKEALRLDPGLTDARDNLTDAEAELRSRKD